MTVLELASFCKFAQQQLTTDLILKYNNAFNSNRLPYQTASSDNTRVSYGPPMKMNPSISSGGDIYNKFVNSIASQESSGRMNAINKQSGALGLYQFMPSTLKGLGYTGSYNDFLKNPQLQTEYMHKFTQNNAKSLGIDIKNLTVNQAGILAAAHYGGLGGARKYMKNNQGYLNTSFYGKTPNSYVSDMRNRITNFKPVNYYYK